MARYEFNPNVHSIEECRDAFLRIRKSIELLDIGGIGTGKGDVFGSGAQTDNAIVRFDGATEYVIKTSPVTIDNSGVIAGASLPTTSLTGTLQAAQFPALTGDVTTSAGSLATTIANDAVTFAKMQNITAASSTPFIAPRVIGRVSDTPSPGDPEEFYLTASGSLNWTLDAGGLTATIDIRVDGTTVEEAGAPVTLRVKDAGITFAKIQNLNQNEIIGRSASGSGVSSAHTFPLASLALGDILYVNATPAWAKLSGNTTATKKFLSQTGNGSISAVPSWEVLVSGDLPSHTHAFTNITPVATDRLLGRDTAGSGAAEEITVGGGIEFTGSGGIQRSAFTGGDVTGSAGSATLTIANDAVTAAKMANITGSDLNTFFWAMGRLTGSTGDPETFQVFRSGPLSFTYNAPSDITLGVNTDTTTISVSGGNLRRSALTGDVTSSAGSATVTVNNDAITNAKLNNMAVNTIKGRITSGTGDPEDLTATQVRTILSIDEAGDQFILASQIFQ